METKANDAASPRLSETRCKIGNTWTHDTVGGLTKREHFAALAMNGALSGTPGPHLNPQTLARDSVAHADALIAALNQDSP